MTILFIITLVLGCFSLMGKGHDEDNDLTGCLILGAIIGLIMLIISLIVK